VAVTEKDLERPKEGARLGFRLVLRATWRMLACLFSRHAKPMQVKLANNGGPIPYLRVEPGHAVPRVRFLDLNEGEWERPSFSRFKNYAWYALTTITGR